MFKMTKYQQTGMLLCCYVKWYLLTYSYKWSFQAAPEFIMPLPSSVSRLHGSNISVKPFTLHPSPRPKNVSKEFNHLHLSPLRASSTWDFSHNIFIFLRIQPSCCASSRAWSRSAWDQDPRMCFCSCLRPGFWKSGYMGVTERNWSGMVT